MGVPDHATSHAWLHLLAIGAVVNVLAASQTVGAQETQVPPEDRVALGDLLRTLTASLTPTPRQEQST